MSYYYQYTFVSPDALYARIEEELKSYFDAGMVDNLMFPVWTDKCLKKLGRATFPIEHAVLDMCDFEAIMPPDFKYVREAWLCTSVVPIIHQLPGAYYKEITTCLNPDYAPVPGCLNTCNPEIVNLTYKTTTQSAEFPITLRYLLQPGTVDCKINHCGPNSPNLGASSHDTFEVVGNKFRTNFREGLVYLLYYAEDKNEEGYQLIPDNYRIQEFIEAFIKQKIFEQLYNQVVDETFNQIERKYQTYKQMADEAYIIALTEIKKETVYDKVKAIKRDQHSLDSYIADIMGASNRDRWGLGGRRGSGRRRYL